MNRWFAVGVIALLTACAAPIETEPFPGVPWTDADGGAVSPETLALYSDDCPGRASAGFLDLMWPLDDVPGVSPEMRRYVRDPESVMPTSQLLAPYDRASALPRGALFSGFATPEYQLWIGPDDDIYLYLVYGSRVEALPRALDETITCP